MTGKLTKAQKQTRADLRAMLKLLKPKKAWGQGVNAENRFGAMVKVNDPEAVRWCLNGAAMKVTEYVGRHQPNDRFLNVVRALDAKLFPPCFSCPRTSWNDDPKRKHSEVLNVIRKAHDEVGS